MCVYACVMYMFCICVCLCVHVCMHLYVLAFVIISDALIPLFTNQSNADTFWIDNERYQSDTDTLVHSIFTGFMTIILHDFTFEAYCSIYCTN